MRFLVGVTAAFGAGTLIGIGLGHVLLEEKFKKEYEKSSASMRRSYEAALIDAQTPVELDSNVIHVVRHPDEGVRLDGGEVEVTTANTFADTVSERGQTIIDHVNAGTNPYWDSSTVAQAPAVVYFAQLEEEDYYEADGRDKEQITMIWAGEEPQFFMNGEEIDNVFDLVGGTIVDDMRESVREGAPVLWIRNNQTEVDYEVVFEQP